MTIDMEKITFTDCVSIYTNGICPTPKNLATRDFLGRVLEKW